ncbi:unnamed protein product [Malus baccata var. baccata]
MVTVFKSFGLWNLVENEAEGLSKDAVNEEMTTVFMRDAKALEIIQNAVYDQIFPRIANADSAKMAWDLLYGEYHSGDQVRSVKLQNLRREFEYARMRDDESLSGYHTRYKGKPKCYNCERFGHWARECTASKSMQKANNANQIEVAGNLFYANSTISGSVVSGEWYIDSGCINHMTGNEKLLVDIRTNVVGKVQMPTGELMNVAGMGTLVIDTSKGRKYIKEMPKSTSLGATPEGQDHTQSPSLLSFHESASDISSSMRKSQAFDHTPLRWRNLDDVLAQCNLCIMELKKFDEATKDESRMIAMKDELQMIEKNAT